MLRVHSIETFGTHEGPGVRFVLFLQGCKLRCLYCHNPDTQAMTGGTMMSIEEIVEKVEKERVYFGEKGGLTASGGEPILQAEALGALFETLRARGIHTALDTNGALAIDEHIEHLLAHTNLVILDVKHLDDTKHRELTGKSNRNVLAFADYCENKGITMWLRHVLVPGYTDSDEHLNAWGAYFQNYKHVERAEILPYHTLGAYKYKKLGIPYKLEGVKPPTTEQVAHAKMLLQNHLPNVFVR